MYYDTPKPQPLLPLQPSYKKDFNFNGIEPIINLYQPYYYHNYINKNRYYGNMDGIDVINFILALGALSIGAVFAWWYRPGAVEERVREGLEPVVEAVEGIRADYTPEKVERQADALLEAVVVKISPHVDMFKADMLQEVDTRVATYSEAMVPRLEAYGNALVTQAVEGCGAVIGNVVQGYASQIGSEMGEESGRARVEVQQAEKLRGMANQGAREFGKALAGQAGIPPTAVDMGMNYVQEKTGMEDEQILDLVSSLYANKDKILAHVGDNGGVPSTVTPNKTSGGWGT